MTAQLIARQSITINAPINKVWDALVSPAAIKQYLFGTNVSSDWKVGSPITWKGEWQGKTYEDKGVVLQADRERLLKYTHFSPLSGVPDRPENYHTVSIELSQQKSGIVVSLSQDGNPTEEARQHSEKNWGMVLAGLKKLLEE